MISPLDDARAAVESLDNSAPPTARDLVKRDALRALIQHAEELERRLERVETRLTRIEEPDRPPSGLKPTIGADA